MTIYAKCNICMKLVPSFPLNMRHLCPEHNSNRYWKMAVDNWLLMRNVPIDVFNLYDENRHRLCRGCGKPVFCKDGKRSGMVWHNSVECRSRVLEAYFSMQWKNCVNLILNNSLEFPLRGSWVQCEGCGQFFHYEKIQIHHLEPVSILDETNFELCWDPQNLVRLCRKCHSHAEGHQKIYAARRVATHAREAKQFRKLDTFLSPPKSTGENITRLT